MSFDAWTSLRAELHRHMDPEEFKVWIEPVQPVEENGRLELACPNTFHRSWLRDNYLPQIRQMCKAKEINCQLSLGLADAKPAKPALASSTLFSSDTASPVIAEPETPKTAAQKTAAPKSIVTKSSAARVAAPRQVVTRSAGYQQLELPKLNPHRPSLNRGYMFDNFITGGGNELAFAASKALSRGSGMLSSSLFLVSGTGLGKSHLSQAVGHNMMKHCPESRVAYLTAEDFANQMISAIRKKNMEQFKDRFRRQCDLLLLEGVQFLAGKRKTQDELIYTLDCLMDAGKKIVLTGSTHPGQVKGLNRELLSRLDGGLTVNIEAPDFDTRVNILHRLAQDEGLYVDPEVLQFLAQEITQDVRRLKSALVGLLANGSLTGRNINLGMAAEVVGQMQRDVRRLNPEKIRETVCRIYGLKDSEITSKSRKRVITRPRNIAMYLSRRHTDASFSAIGKVFSRDHSTVVYAVDQIDRLKSREPKLAQELTHIEQKLGVE